MRLVGRRLSIEGAPSEWHLAAFSGPVHASAVRSLGGRRPHLALMLGGVGDDDAEIGRTLTALGELGAPVLVIAGGADRHEALERAFGALEGQTKDRVVDASALRSIRVGAIELVPLAGAPEGRYAITNEACGLSAADAEEVASALEDRSADVHRYVVSWAGPSATIGVASVEGGSARVSELIERTGAEGALFAWPSESAGRIEREPLRVAVRPLTGPWIVAADGSRVAPGATLLTAGREGLAVADDSP